MNSDDAPFTTPGCSDELELRLDLSPVGLTAAGNSAYYEAEHERVEIVDEDRQLLGDAALAGAVAAQRLKHLARATIAVSSDGQSSSILV